MLVTVMPLASSSCVSVPAVRVDECATIQQPGTTIRDTMVSAPSC
jgi:hypothetical protein